MSASVSVPTATDVYDDRRSIAATPSVTGAKPLVTSEAGTVTASTCTPGGMISAGTAPLTVDDRRVIALATSRPMWRDFEFGLAGEDVRALQEELVRLGYSAPVDGVYGAATELAVAALQASVGISATSPLSVRSVLWIPAPSVTVASCEATVASTVEPGATYATVRGDMTALMVDVPSAVVPGPRVLVYGEASTPLPPSGGGSPVVVTDPVFLAAIASGPDFATWQASAGAEALTIDYVLADPIETVSVPPGALFALEGDSGCVRSGATNYPVTVVASTLGQTLVQFSGPDVAIPAMVDTVGRDAPLSCG